MGSCFSRCWCSCCTIEVIRRIVLNSNVPCRLSRFKSSSGSFDVTGRSGQRYTHCRKSSDVTSVISSLNTPEIGHREQITSFTENEISYTTTSGVNCLSNSVDSVNDSLGGVGHFIQNKKNGSTFTQKFWTFTGAFKKSRDRTSEYLHQSHQQCTYEHNSHHHHLNHVDFDHHHQSGSNCQQATSNSSPHYHQLCHCESNSRSSSIVSLCGGDNRSPKCHSRNKLYPFKCIYNNKKSHHPSSSNSLDAARLDTVVVSPVAMSKATPTAAATTTTSSKTLHCISKGNQSNLCHTGHTNEASEFMDSNEATAIAVINVTPMTMTSACTSTSSMAVVSNARTNNNNNNNRNSNNKKQQLEGCNSVVVEKDKWINSKSCQSKFTSSTSQVHNHLAHYASLIRRSIYGSSTESEVALFGLESESNVLSSASLGPVTGTKWSLPLSHSNNSPSNSTATATATATTASPTSPGPSCDVISSALKVVGPSEADKIQAALRNTSNSAVDTLPKVTSGHGQYTGVSSGGLFGQCVPSSAKTAKEKDGEVEQGKKGKDEKVYPVYPSSVKLQRTSNKLSHPHHLTSTEDASSASFASVKPPPGTSAAISSVSSCSTSSSSITTSNSLSSRISSRMLAFIRSNGQHQPDDVTTDDETTFSSIDSRASGKFLLPGPSDVTCKSKRGNYFTTCNQFGGSGATSSSSASTFAAASSSFSPLSGDVGEAACTSLYSGQHSSSNSNSIRSRLSSLLMMKGASGGGGGTTSSSSSSSNSGPVSTSSSSTIKITPSAWVRKANSVIPFTVSGKLTGVTCKGPKESINSTTASVNKSASNASLSNHLKLRRSLSKASDSDSMMEFENLMYDFDIPEPTDVILELQSPPSSSSGVSTYTRANNSSKSNLISCATCSCECNNINSALSSDVNRKSQEGKSTANNLTNCHHLCTGHPHPHPSCYTNVTRDADVASSCVNKSSWVQFNENSPNVPFNPMTNVPSVTLATGQHFACDPLNSAGRNGTSDSKNWGVSKVMMMMTSSRDENKFPPPSESSALVVAGFNGYVEQCMKFRVPCIPIVKSNNSLDTIDTPAPVSTTSSSSSSTAATLTPAASSAQFGDLNNCLNCKCFNNNYTNKPEASTAKVNYCYNLTKEGTNVPLVTPCVSSSSPLNQMMHHNQEGQTQCQVENEKFCLLNTSKINSSSSSFHCCHHHLHHENVKSLAHRKNSNSHNRNSSSSSSQLPLMDPLLSQVLEETYILAVTSRNKSTSKLNANESTFLNNNLNQVECCTVHSLRDSNLQVTSSSPHHHHHYQQQHQQQHQSPHHLCHDVTGSKVISKESPSKSSTKSCEDTNTNYTLGCPGGDRSSIASIDGLDLEWDDYDQTNIRPEDEDEEHLPGPHHTAEQEDEEREQQGASVILSQAKGGDNSCEDGHKLHSQNLVTDDQGSKCQPE